MPVPPRLATATLLAALALALPLPARAQDDRWLQRVRSFARENGRLEPGRRHVVLLGSSSMEGWRYGRRVQRFLPTVGSRSLNRGISGDGIGIRAGRGIKHRLQVSVFDAQPSHVFLLNGRNSLGYGVERTAEVYEEVVAEIRARLPDTVLCLVTCAPVSGRYAHMADDVVALNARLREIARRHGCALIDLHPLLVAGDGRSMRRDLTSDGLHFKDAGYRLLGERIEAVVAAPPAAEDAAEGRPEDGLPLAGLPGGDGSAAGSADGAAGPTPPAAAPPEPAPPPACPEESAQRVRALLKGLLRRLRGLF